MVRTKERSRPDSNARKRSMLNRTRRGNSVSKLATALCIVATGSIDAVAEPAKGPLQQNPFGAVATNMTTPSAGSRPTASADLTYHGTGTLADPGLLWSPQPLTLRSLIDSDQFPDPPPGLSDTGSSQRNNHFVGISPNAPTSQAHQQQGEIRTNPLIAGTPPNLRRFRADDAKVTNAISAESHRGPALTGRSPLTDCTVEDPSAPKHVDDQPQGLLALDQIGKDFSGEPKESSPPLSSAISDRPEPIAAPFLDRIDATSPGKMVVDKGLIEETIPVLPPPNRGVTEPSADASMDAESIAEVLNAFGPNGLIDSSMTSNPDHPATRKTGRMMGTAKPSSWRDRFVGWSKKLSGGENSSAAENASGAPVSESSQPSAASSPEIRSSGGLPHWFRKNR